MSVKQLILNGAKIRLSRIADDYYLSLHDLAKWKMDRPEVAITQWMSSQATLSYLKAWEAANNADFKAHEVLAFKGWEQLVKDFLSPSFFMSPQKWIDYTNGIGFEIAQGETWVAESIALEFANWINPSYKITLEAALKEYKGNIGTLLDEPLNYN